MTNSRNRKDNSSWAPQHVYDSILRYTVIPTFDLILDSPDGILLVRRRLEPYRGTWGLPGLRMLKGETIETCLRRIAVIEVGIRIDPIQRTYVNQVVGRFRSQQERQDVSTCYAFQVEARVIDLNRDHFSGFMLIKDPLEAPARIGAVYRDHLKHYFARPQ